MAAARDSDHHTHNGQVSNGQVIDSQDNNGRATMTPHNRQAPIRPRGRRCAATNQTTTNQTTINQTTNSHSEAAQRSAAAHSYFSSSLPILRLAIVNPATASATRYPACHSIDQSGAPVVIALSSATP